MGRKPRGEPVVGIYSADLNKKFIQKGLKVKNKAKIKNYLLEKIEKDNPVQVEKVERYLNLLTIFYDLDKDIKAKGLMVETVNASQTFLKPNPAIAEKNKVNTSLISIEKSLGLNKQNEDEPSPRRGLV